MKNTITYIAITLSFCSMLIGCYSQKKATRQLFKVQAHYPKLTAQLCSNSYPPLVQIKDSIIHLPGRVKKEKVFVTVDCDSILKSNTKVKTVKVPCPPSEYRTDTILVYQERQVVNKAQVAVLEHERNELAKALTKEEQHNYILLRLAIVLAAYTILRWVLRIWNIKLP